jgi:hypothetical protein
MIILQGASSPEPSTVYVDLRALRNDRVSLVERGSPHSLCLMESGKLLPGVKVIIANPETKGQCGDSHLGEVWTCLLQFRVCSLSIYLFHMPDHRASKCKVLCGA